MTELRSLTLGQLATLCSELNWPRYVADQLFTWLWAKGVNDLAEMTNLSKEKRAWLAERYSLSLPQVQRVVNDSEGTFKFTLQLVDGHLIESVYLPEHDRRTVCVSTQVGCKLNCRFCYTGRMGFKRDLAWHEIASQVLLVRALAPRPSPLAITNVVFMGMGEPFLNYDATIEAAKTANAANGLAIGARRITISTAGIPAAIRALAELPHQFRLALSLNAADEHTRSELMPVNRLHPLSEVMDAVRYYVRAKGKRVTFEYVLVEAVNNRNQDAVRLAALLKDIPCKVNLIPLNPFPGCELRAPADRSIQAFARQLWPLLPAVTIRRSKGAGILAGCGQLATLGERIPIRAAP
ncbi:23S rRNA (adenine(2503)-C(2))-methyltransferase RlmN [candidate division WOR-3 bacterium]|nr:23S rRNA (adenine(2503)-C(2))-methyltransferase RlmN [candidate division WOR-3 bacterium]